MADVGTIRTRAVLIGTTGDGTGVGVKLPDNSTNLITEAVMRDVVASTLNTMSAATVTAGTTALSLEHGYVFANAAGGAITLTVPAPSAAYAGHKFCVVKTDSSTNLVTLSGQTILGYMPPYSISAQYFCVWITCNGTSWYTTDESLAVGGRQSYHGVEDRVTTSGALPTTITTPVFTIPATTYPLYYWKRGVRYSILADQSVALTPNGPALTAGSVVSNQYYAITTYVAGDFSNLGTAFSGTMNTTGCVFKATTGTTPTSWGGSTLKNINGMFVVYYNNPSNLLTAADIAGGPINADGVLIAAVNWNGSDLGLVTEERHGYQRSIPWHIWAHNTVGCRYRSGLTMTVAPNATPTLSTFSITAGEIADEDIQFTIGVNTTARIFYQDSATTYKFDNTLSTIPGKLGANSRPMYVASGTYVLTQTTSTSATRFYNMFVYATNDLICPIYIFLETTAATTGYATIATARAVPFPNLSAFKIGQELKPIYRIIWTCSGVLQAIDTTQDDYRTVSSLPISAGSAATTANIVTVSPAGKITATNVQTALEQLDSRNGWANYSHSGSTQAYTGPTAAALANDEGGGQQSVAYLPPTITVAPWSSGQLHFTSLNPGDEVMIRVNLEVTTSVSNQEFRVYLRLAIGGTEYAVNDGDFFYKTAELHYVGVVIPLYMTADTIANPGEVMFQSADNATIKVIGFYISIRNK